MESWKNLGFDNLGKKKLETLNLKNFENNFEFRTKITKKPGKTWTFKQFLHVK